MSKEAWLFLFAATSSIGSIAQLLQFLGVKLPMMRSAPSPTRPNALGRVVFLALLSLVLSCIGFYQTIGASAVATLVQFVSFVPAKGFPPHIGEPIALNITAANTGPLPNAEDVVMASDVLLHAPMSPEEEEHSYTSWKTTARKSLPIDLTTVSPDFATRLTPPLTERDVKDIADGRLLVYMFGFITYHDPRGNHETQLCRYLQPPADQLLWHFCAAGHNRTR